MAETTAGAAGADAVPAELTAYSRPVIRRNRAVGTGSALAALAAVIGLPVLVTVAVGSTYYERLYGGYPGPASAIVAAGARAVTDAAGVVTVGALVALLFLTGRHGASWRVVDSQPEMRLARVAASVWAVMALLMIAVDAADRNGAPLSAAFAPGNLAYLIHTGYLPGSWIVVSVLVGTAAMLLWFAWEWLSLLLPLVLCLLGALAPVVVGQVLVGPNHDYGSDAATLQTVAAAVLFGLLVAATVRTGTGRLLRPVTLRRAWATACCCWVVVAAMDAVITPFKLAGPQAFVNPTGMLIAARVAVLLLCGAILAAAWMQRRRLTDRRIRTMLLCATVLAGGWIGLTAAMVRVPPPVFFTRTTIRQLFFGYNLPQPPTILTLATAWRPNILFLVMASVAVAGYLAAVRRLHRRGDRWPVGRTVAWIAGWAVVTVTTSSGMGKYSGANFAVHMTDHMTLNMLAPLLLVLGGVVTLLLRATRPARRGQAAGAHEWLNEVLQWKMARVAYNPLRVFIEYIAAYYVLYLTPLFSIFIRYHWAHRLMQVEFLLIGYLFFAIIIGVDRPPRPLPQIGKLGYALAAMPFHAFFGVIMMMSATPIAADFYRLLAAPWATDLEATQKIAGGIAWAGGELPFLVVLVVLAVQWMRQDDKRARRKDRHMDAGLDDDFAVYNDMLRRLDERAHRRAAGPAAPAEEPR